MKLPEDKLIMDTSPNITEEIKNKFIEYILERDKELSDENLEIIVEEGFNIWIIAFDDEMDIFNITEDVKEFCKEYIRNNDETVTQWIVYQNNMTIFNTTKKAQEVFKEYIDVTHPQ